MNFSDGGFGGSGWLYEESISALELSNICKPLTPWLAQSWPGRRADSLITPSADELWKDQSCWGEFWARVKKVYFAWCRNYRFRCQLCLSSIDTFWQDLWADDVLLVHSSMVCRKEPSNHSENCKICNILAQLVQCSFLISVLQLAYCHHPAYPLRHTYTHAFVLMSYELSGPAQQITPDLEAGTHTDCLRASVQP